MADLFNFSIPRLGEAKIASPIKMSKTYGDSRVNYVEDNEFILYDIDVEPNKQLPLMKRENILEKAGPREKIYFNPGHVHAGIVTCGGLCPGLKDFIK